MVHPNRRVRRGFPILPLLLGLLLVGALVVLSVMEPPHRPAAVNEAIPSDRLPL